MHQIVTFFRVSFVIAASPLVSLVLTQAQIAQKYFPQLPNFAVATAALILGGISADSLAKFLLHIKGVRRALLGKAYVEGHWYLQTEDSQNISNDAPGVQIRESPLKRDGVLYLRYLLDKNEVKVVTTRLTKDRASTIATESKVAYVGDHGPTITYLNFFELNADGEQDYGVTAGSFSLSDALKSPDLLQTTMVTYHGNKTFSQRGYKIQDCDVKLLSKSYGKAAWIPLFLATDGATIAQKVGELKSSSIPG
jgi:hypothetical protein